MLVLSKESPQGLSKYGSVPLVSKRINFTWGTNRAYLENDNRFSKDWIIGSPWIGDNGWFYLGPIELMKWSDEE